MVSMECFGAGTRIWQAVEDVFPWPRGLFHAVHGGCPKPQEAVDTRDTQMIYDDLVFTNSITCGVIDEHGRPRHPCQV